MHRPHCHVGRAEKGNEGCAGGAAAGHRVEAGPSGGGGVPEEEPRHPRPPRPSTKEERRHCRLRAEQLRFRAASPPCGEISEVASRTLCQV